MPLLLYYGDNTLAMSEAVAVLRQEFHPADTLTFDAPSTPLAAIREACLTAGLFATQRLVIVRQLHERIKGRAKENAEAAHIADTIAGVAPTTTLLLLSRDLKSDNALIGSVRAAGGQVKSFTMPRKQDLTSWILARAVQRKMQLDRNAADLLADAIGSNAVMLDIELEKLATYAGEGTRVTPEMVSGLVGAVTQETIFALVDAIAYGNTAIAFRMLREHFEQASTGSTGAALYLISMLARQLRTLLRIKVRQRKGEPNASILSDLKIPAYFADRHLRQAKRLSEERLKAAFEQLATLDHALKTGRADPITGLDLLIADLCA